MTRAEQVTRPKCARSLPPLRCECGERRPCQCDRIAASNREARKARTAAREKRHAAEVDERTIGIDTNKVKAPGRPIAKVWVRGRKGR